MAKYTSVLHQLLRHVPRDEFRAIVERHQGDKGVRKLSCWGQFVALFFGQLTGQHSLRETWGKGNDTLRRLCAIT